MRTPLRRLALGLLALTAAATPVVLRPVASASPVPRPPALSFGPGQPVDPQRDQSEPNIEIDAEGRIYTCGPTGFTTGADYAQVSTDGGDQFHLLGTPPRGQLADRGGGDCYIATGKEKNAAGTYTVNYIGLADLDFTTATSRDYGAGFAAMPTTCSGVTDRQWTTFTDAETAYLIYNDIEPRNTVVQKSVDGGLTWDGYGPCFETAKKVGAPNPDFPGPIKADVRNNPVDATKPHIYFGYNRGNNVFLSSSVDDGNTWRNCLIAETENDPSNGFVTVDHDNEGNLYAAWGEKGGEEDAFRVMYSWLPNAAVAGCESEDANPGWAAPKQVDQAPVKTIVFPWLVASGAPGHVAITWYGSTSDGVADSDTFKGAWDVYVAQTTGAHYAVPGWEQVKATTHPMHYDQICLSGLACAAGGDRSLADFFAMALDPTTGRLVVVYNETQKLPDATGGSVAIPNVLVQNTGISNLDHRELATRREVVRTASTDPEGDALAPYSFSTLLVPEQPPDVLVASRDNQDALDFTSVKVEPEVDLDSGERVPDGGLTVTLTLKSLDSDDLEAALEATGATSLIWAFRWVNGYQPAALSVHWDPARGFGGGFDDFSTGSVTCIGSEAKCLTYPGATEVPFDVNADSGVIRLSVPRDKLEALGAPDEHGRPTVGEAKAGSRFYSGTAFSMGNASVNEAQGFLYPVDGAAAFDFVLPGTTTGGGDGDDDETGGGDDDDSGGPGGGGDDDGLPATGGLGWPLAAVVLAAAGAFALRLRRTA